MYPLEVGVGATWCGIRRTLFAMKSGGMVKSSVGFEIEGEWTRLADTWSEDKSLDTLFATGLLVRAWSVILGGGLLNLSDTCADAVTSFRHM